MEAYLWPLVIFHGIVGIIGLPGNALIILVYARKRQMVAPHVFILALAVADFFVCLFTPFIIYHWFKAQSYSSDFLCRLVITMNFVIVYNSCFLTSAIAVDRYQAICRPLRRWMTVPRAKLTAVICATLAVLMSIPAFTSYRVVYEGGADTGKCGINMEAPAWVRYITYTVNYTSSILSVVINVTLYTKMSFVVRKRAAVHPSQTAAAAGPSGLSRSRAPIPVPKRPINSPGLKMASVAVISNHPYPTSSSADTDIISGPGKKSHPTSLAHQQEEHQPQHQQQQQAIRREQQQCSLSKSNSSAASGANKPVQPEARLPKLLLGKTTIMLVVTAAVFFSTWLIALTVVSIPQSILGHIRQTNGTAYGFLTLLRYIFYLNNAVNPFIYGAINKQFQLKCRKIFQTLRCGGT